ncbi:response regulator transcription factor [Algoriphagus jejuensis]|uniref:Response regulator transcription factor n=1 Tax=Algoriphagus jejuensis TaxID=419934 RepID=A0ABN1N148_9BACT
MIKLLIYEDNTQLREGLTMLIDGSEGFSVQAAFRNCSNVVHEVKTFRPEVILMDIDMPGVNGLDGLKLVKATDPAVSVLMLTVFDDHQNIFQALLNGANGYILKKTPPAKLLEYIQEASTGGAPMTASVAAQVLKMFSQINLPADKSYGLSDREKEVLQFLVNGYSYKMIAAEMFIAMDTVRSHIKKIYEKLHVNSKSEAVAKAFRDKLL